MNVPVGITWSQAQHYIQEAMNQKYQRMQNDNYWVSPIGEGQNSEILINAFCTHKNKLIITKDWGNNDEYLVRAK